ncbi:hypothetical protein PCE1_001144 [Barthelona sp. PCE]
MSEEGEFKTVESIVSTDEEQGNSSEFEIDEWQATTVSNMALNTDQLAILTKKRYPKVAFSHIFPSFFALFATFVGFSMLGPLLPKELGRFNASSLEYTLVNTVFSLTAFIFCSIFGKISDQYGRKFGLMICVTGLCVSLIAQTFATSVLTHALSRLLCGVFASLTAIINGYISDITERGSSIRVQLISWVATSMSAASVIGTFMSGFIFTFTQSFRDTMLIGCAFHVANVFISMFIFSNHLEPPKKACYEFDYSVSREDLADLNALRRSPSPRPTLKIVESEAEEGRERNDSFLTGADVDHDDIDISEEMHVVYELETHGFFDYLRYHIPMRYIVGIQFLLWSAFQTYIVVIPYDLDIMGYEPDHISYVILCSAVGQVLSQAFFQKRVIKRIGLIRSSTIGLSAIGIALFIFIFSTSIVTHGIISFFIGFSMSLCSGPLMTLLTNYTTTVDTGKILGFNQSSVWLSRLVFPLIFSALYDVNKAIPFIASSITLFIGVFLLLKLKNHMNLDINYFKIMYEKKKTEQ